MSDVYSKILVGECPCYGCGGILTRYYTEGQLGYADRCGTCNFEGINLYGIPRMKAFSETYWNVGISLAHPDMQPIICPECKLEPSFEYQTYEDTYRTRVTYLRCENGHIWGVTEKDNGTIHMDSKIRFSDK